MSTVPTQQEIEAAIVLLVQNGYSVSKMITTPVENLFDTNDRKITTTKEPLVFDRIFDERVRDQPLSVRVMNCLIAENIYYIGDLVQCSKKSITDIQGVGKTTVREIEEFLIARGLHFETRLSGWIPARD